MSSYAIAWLVYSVSAAGCLLVGWQVFGWRFLKPVRIPLLLLVLAFLLVPVHMAERPGWYAPSVMGAAVALLDEGVEAMLALLELPATVGGWLVAGWALLRLGVLGIRRLRARQQPVIPVASRDMATPMVAATTSADAHHTGNESPIQEQESTP
ncbi:MAG: hypothetical protein EP312_03140 [Gammaproteobacteria bacterium]|nr:MAG: hypothetical protein EP312_03140 [Gammaproteobacteria bacterium]